MIEDLRSGTANLEADLVCLWFAASGTVTAAFSVSF